MQARPQIRSPHDIQVYLGMMVWFKDFILDFFALTKPLTRLLVKDIPWQWGQDQEEAISIPTWSPPLPSLNSLTHLSQHSCFRMLATLRLGGGLANNMESEFTLYATGPGMTRAERGYSIYDKKLLALVSMVSKHSHLLRCVPFTSNTDHRALESLQTQVKLKGRQVRWIEMLQEYDFKIQYQPANKMRVADWLTRNPTLHTLCTKCSELPACRQPHSSIK
jgi:hypothetical protein